MKKRVWYISQMADPALYDMSIFADCPGGDQEVEWIKLQLENIGLLDQVDFQGVSVERGGALPDFDEVDIAFLGGSYHSVHDNFPWQQALQNWLEAYRKTEKPLMGICGGHQQMATQLGANVGTVVGGPMAASEEIFLTEAGENHFLYHDIPRDQLTFHFGNYEHVEAAPEGAVVLATRPEMPAMAIDYGNNWYSVQYHPEARYDIFSCSWKGSNPEFCKNYVDLPHAPKMLKNYILRYLS